MTGAIAAHEPVLAARVPFTRMDHADPALLEELLGTVREVAECGAFTLGHHVEAFERDFADYCETDFAVGVSSGTEALVLALRALEIGPGDEVIVPANSFIATAEAVSAVGATPLPVDVDPDSHLITAELIAASLNLRVRCAIPVHLFGATVDMDPILELAREAGIHVLEDACQAHGARYRGRRVGTLGALGCFSFYPAKNLGAWGDGGAVVTAVPELADRVQLLRSHGERPRYHHRLVGATARLDALQAAVLRRKLTRLDGWNDERRRLGAQLRARIASAGEGQAGMDGALGGQAGMDGALGGQAGMDGALGGQAGMDGALGGQAGMDGVLGMAAEGGRRSPEGSAGSASALAVDPVHLPFAGADHVHHLFVVRCAQRDELRKHLAERGVATGIHYPVPIHRTAAYADLGLGPGSLPVSEALAERICSLPIFPGMSEAELEQVAGAVAAFTGTPAAQDPQRLPRGAPLPAHGTPPATRGTPPPTRDTRPFAEDAPAGRR
ncbi:MAG TPA: DegT/DnrJ/EryC1/StrS family aminotransferase [Solirubrobacteraceae bacterium]|nr:DegT/DnrJ/EryC1/StrS family aminotransferase [Solirubrobacteraceae bacterium]